jgi:DNA-binding NarL/FixJ family response regulator
MLFSDISMPILNGIGAANKLKDSGCRSKIVFLTVHADSDYVLRCLVTGTHGCVAKCHMATDLLPAINEALAGRNFIFSKLPPLELRMITTPNRVMFRSLSTSACI